MGNPNGWQNILLNNSIHFGAHQHCLPINDLKPHELDQNGTCWCHPTESPDVADYWIHNSLDGREKYEEGQKLN